jgi:hypothetical protein
MSEANGSTQSKDPYSSSTTRAAAGNFHDELTLLSHLLLLRFPVSRRTPSPPRRPTLRARTNVPQIKPRINPQIMPIIPRKLKRILAHCLGRHRLHRRLEHRQSPRRQLHRLARLASRLQTLILAKRARTSVPQKRKRIDGPVPVLPLDLHPGSRSQVNHHRLRIVRQPRRHISLRHKSQYKGSCVASGAPASATGVGG